MYRIDPPTFTVNDWGERFLIVEVANSAWVRVFNKRPTELEVLGARAYICMIDWNWVVGHNYLPLLRWIRQARRESKFPYPSPVHVGHVAEFEKTERVTQRSYPSWRVTLTIKLEER